MLKFSIIVPIYKVQKYLDECIESILSQTYANIEVILVDDGSPDECPAICDSYAARDPRVIVIHKENGGLVSARQAGAQRAVGNYICCVDNGDYGAPDYTESMVDILELALPDSRSLITCDIQLTDTCLVGASVQSRGANE